MRLHKGKENCHIIDLVAALSTGVVSTPTLFGLDPGEIVEGMDSKGMEELKERKEKEERREQQLANVGRSARPNNGVMPGMLTFTDYDSVHDLIADSAGDQFIRQMSQYAWVGVGDGKYVLTTNSGHYIMIEPSGTDDKYLAKWYRKLPSALKVKAPYAAPRVIAEGESLEHVVHAADTYASEVFEHMWISKHQAWRRSPASKAQLEFLNKAMGEEEKPNLNGITKGKAADMITRLKHGAKGRYSKVISKKKAEERMKERAEATRQRLQGQVRVGPLAEQVSVG
jgi:ATP-dependent helicase IRC3